MDARHSSAFLSFTVVAVTLCSPHFAHAQTAPCSLLTEKQVSTILGVSVGAASPIATTGCSWKSARPPQILVSVSMQTEKLFDGAKSMPASNMTKTPVSGIGDEAFFVSGPNFSSLWVRKGVKFPLIRLYGLPVNDAQTKLKALAADVLSKL